MANEETCEAVEVLLVAYPSFNVQPLVDGVGAIHEICPIGKDEVGGKET